MNITTYRGFDPGGFACMRALKRGSERCEGRSRKLKGGDPIPMARGELEGYAGEKKDWLTTGGVLAWEKVPKGNIEYGKVENFTVRYATRYCIEKEKEGQSFLDLVGMAAMSKLLPYNLHNVFFFFLCFCFCFCFYLVANALMSECQLYSNWT